MTTLLFTLVFTYSGVSYHLNTDLTVHQCVAKMIYEKEAIKLVQQQQQFPELAMTVACQPQ